MLYMSPLVISPAPERKTERKEKQKRGKAIDVGLQNTKRKNP